MPVPRSAALFALLGGAFAVLPSCKSSLDSLGCIERKLDGGDDDAAAGVTLGPLAPPLSYPNAFRDLLGKSESEIAAKIADTYAQLFHGDPTDEAIFVPVGADQAYILDVLHDQIRSEGIGFGMLVAVELDKRDDFDRLWRYAKANAIASGPAQGYLPSYCGDPNGDYVCNDPFGMQQIATSLLLARGRWQASPGNIDYGREFANLLDTIRNKEIHNCGTPGDVTALFDADRKLPYDIPTTASANLSRPSIVMPASYELWFQATGDPFWAEAAAAARAYLKAVAHPKTGFVPEKTTFDGKAVPGFDRFAPECDRALINMAMDRLWSSNQIWPRDQANRVLQFFYAEGLTTYGQIYSLDGSQELATLHDMPLVAANGVLAVVATMDRRADFVNEVWLLSAPTGKARYYPGMLHMLALVILSGQMRVY